MNSTILRGTVLLLTLTFVFSLLVSPVASSEPYPCRVDEDTNTEVGEKIEYGPCANFTYSPEGPTVSDTIVFDASPSYQPLGGEIEDYFWYFGRKDRVDDTGLTTRKSFDEPGNYTVILGVLNNRRQSTDYERTIRILDSPPSAEFTYSPTDPILKQGIVFDASDSYDIDGDIKEYTWNMGDGTTVEGMRFEHAYDEYGEYEVMLTVNDGSSTDTERKTVDITPVAPKPEIEFIRLPDDITVDDSIELDASGTRDSDSEELSYTWEFGDGDTARGLSVNHSYSVPGEYRITLTVNDGNKASTTQETVRVGNRPHVVNMGYSPKTNLTTEANIVFNSSASYDPDTSIQEARWDLGDGETATGEVVEHSYEEFGTYNVSVEVSDGAVSSSRNVSVAVTPPEGTMISVGSGLIWIGFGIDRAVPSPLFAVVILVGGLMLVVFAVILIMNRHLIERYILLRPA